MTPSLLKPPEKSAWRCMKNEKKAKLSKQQKLMKACIREAKELLEVECEAEYQSDVLGIALSFFRKRVGVDSCLFMFLFSIHSFLTLLCPRPPRAGARVSGPRRYPGGGGRGRGAGLNAGEITLINQRPAGINSSLPSYPNRL